MGAETTIIAVLLLTLVIAGGFIFQSSSNTLTYETSSNGYQTARCIVASDGTGNAISVQGCLDLMKKMEGTIYVKSGYYPIFETINLQTGQWLVGSGAGTNNTYLDCRLTDNLPCIKLNGIVGGKHTSWSGVSNLILVGNRTEFQTGILVNGASDFILSGLRIVGFNGIAMDFNDAWDGVISNNWINDSGSSDQLLPAVRLADGINIGTTTNNELKFNNNLFESSLYTTLEIGDYAWANHFTDNKFHGTTPYPLNFTMITVSETAQNQSFIGNIFHQGGTSPYIILKGNDNRIIGNGFNYGKGEAISILGHRNAIVGNTAQYNWPYNDMNHFNNVAQDNVLSGNVDNGKSA